MDRAYLSGSSASPPAAPASPSIGYPTEGSPGAGTPPTTQGAYWYHMITESLRNIIVAAGFTPSQLDLTLLLQALPGAVASRPEMARSLAANGYQKLPGGLILQWGVCGITASGGPTNGFYYGTAVFTFPITFPSSCLIAFASPQDTAGVEGGASVGTPSATSVSVVTQTTSSGSAYANVFAIGK